VTPSKGEGRRRVPVNTKSRMPPVPQMAFVSRRVGEWAVLVVATARNDEVEPARELRATLRELDRDRRVGLPPITGVITKELD